MGDKSIISVQIPEALDLWLADAAAKRLTSKSAVVREILVGHINAIRPDDERDVLDAPQPASVQSEVEA